MNCLYNSWRLLLSCKSHWTFACWRWVTQAAAKLVRPPIADPANAARAERYAGFMIQSCV